MVGVVSTSAFNFKTLKTNYMQKGSIVECIEKNNGLVLIKDKWEKVGFIIEVRTLLTIREIFTATDGSKALRFDEISGFYHPILKKETGFNIRKFRELQPPMTIRLEELISEPQTI